MSPQVLLDLELQRLLETHPVVDEELSTMFDFPFLNTLASVGEEKLGSMFSQRDCIAGEIILRENELGDKIYIIQSGRVAIVKGSFSEPTLLGYRGAGEVIGEMALLDNLPRSASVIAVEPTHLLGTDKEGFQKLLNGPPFVGLHILESLSSRLRVSDEARSMRAASQRQLSSQISELESEKRHLLEMQQLRQETTDLIVHDLRNPLGAILVALNALEVMLPADTLDENREIIDIALSSCGRMKRLVDSMLEVARMESGETEVVLSPVDPAELIQQITGNILSLHSQNIEWVLELAEPLPTALIDREKIERVLANLLDNALKHTPTGGRITLSAFQQDNELITSVMDTGPGIPPEDRQRIFERFSQVAGEKRKRRGFGLGLTYCKLTVEAHGGRIWVEPGQGGVGSRFIFTLPLAAKNP